ncbi:MAG: hypothetical protein LQ345_006208 [Seirophora villosa]|nr:MAG: hypothetical protein LQ345_006208 [Seirophora villosa]
MDNCVAARYPSGIEALTASAVANAGHIICARTRSVAADSASVKDILTFAKVNRIDVRPLELNISIHNAGHLVFGPFEAFTPDQIAREYDIHCGTHTPRAGNGLVMEQRRRTSYFAAKAGMDALADSYAGEIALWGIETSIIVPGAYTSGTKQFVHAAEPADSAVMQEYEKGDTKALSQRIMNAQIGMVSKAAKPGNVASAIVDVVGMEFG